MKKVILTVLFFSLVSLTFAQDQEEQKVSKIGVYAGLTQSTFYRTGFPSLPFDSGSLFGFEAGIDFPVIQKANFESRLYLGYSIYGANETFADDAQSVETKVSFNALRLAAIPAIYTLDVDKFKVSAGLGGYAALNLSEDVSASTDDVFFEEDLFSSLTYGLQLQLGVRYQRYILNLNLYNSLNNVAEAFIGPAVIKSKGSSLTFSYMF